MQNDLKIRRSLGRYIRLRQSLSRTPFRLFVIALVGVYSLGLTEGKNVVVSDASIPVTMYGIARNS